MSTVTRGGFLRRAGVALAALVGLDAILPDRVWSAVGDDTPKHKPRPYETFCGPHPSHSASDHVTIKTAVVLPDGRKWSARMSASARDIDAVLPEALYMSGDALLYELRRDGILPQIGRG